MSIDLSNLPEVAYVSDVVAVETRRALHRLRLAGRLDDEDFANRLAALAEMEQRLTYLAITRQMLVRAWGAFPTHVRTLDAIHLGTALVNAETSNDEHVRFLTLDVRLARAARGVGFEVAGVVL